MSVKFKRLGFEKEVMANHSGNGRYEVKAHRPPTRDEAMARARTLLKHPFHRKVAEGLAK